MKPIVLLPTYNERNNLENMVCTILAQKLNLDILVIDDNSPDGTGQFADSLKDKYPEVTVLHRSQKLGLGKAYIHGFQVALAHGYDKIITMDCDFSHNPNDLHNLLDASKTYDLVLGSRYVEGGEIQGWSWWRRILSRCGSWYAQLLLRLPYHDLTGGFKCYSKRALQTIQIRKIKANGYAFQIETTYRIYQKGFSIAEIPIIFENRAVGKSKMTFSIALEAIWTIPKIKFSH